MEGEARAAKLTQGVGVQVVLLKLVQQLSQVYQTMRISDFAKLADFLSLHDCEKLIVQAVSNNQVPGCHVFLRTHSTLRL